MRFRWYSAEIIMTLVQIRDLPEAAHRELKARAARAGRTLSEYLRRELVALAERPEPDDLWDRLESRPTARFQESASEVLRRERDER